jgi:hypothetical protein
MPQKNTTTKVPGLRPKGKYALAPCVWDGVPLQPDNGGVCGFLGEAEKTTHPFAKLWPVAPYIFSLCANSAYRR